MQIRISIGVILIGAIIVLGVFVALALWGKKENRQANRLMSLLLASMSLWLIDVFFRISGIYEQNPNFYFNPIYYSFAFGPLLYFYVRSITSSEFKFKLKHLWHFVPVFIQAALYWFLVFQDYSFKRWYWLEIHAPVTYRIEFDGSFVSLAIYLFFSIRLLSNYQSWLIENFSETSQKTLRWLKILLFIMFGLTVFWFVEAVLRDFYTNFYSSSATAILLGVMILTLAFKAFYQTDQDGINYDSTEHKEKPNKILELNQKLLDRIVERMESHKDYLNPTLNLKSFAANCKFPQKQVSQCINQHLNKTFHDFVNGYRVEEFKRIIEESGKGNMTLEGIAYECGFNSKSTFNRIFKKHTGKSPGKYVSK